MIITTSITKTSNDDGRRSSLQIVASDKDWDQKLENNDIAINNNNNNNKKDESNRANDNDVKTTESLSPKINHPQTINTVSKTAESNTLKKAILDALCLSILYTFQFLYIAYIGQLTFFNNLNHRWKNFKLDNTQPLSNFFGLLPFTEIEKQHHHHHQQGNKILSLLREDKKHLTKIPRHLAITLSSELLFERTETDWNTIVNDLCQISCWAWEMGIKEISVYEGSGILKSMAVDIYKQQSKVLHEWKQQHHPTSPSIAENDFGFMILSLDDARSQLVDATKKSYKYIRNNHEKVSSITIDLVNQFMNETMSDPELMVVYDGLPHRYISLDGYPPWHIRLTEFVNATSHHRFDYVLFSSCLYKYSKVEQRVGR